MKKTLVLVVCLAVLASGSVFALDLPDALKIDGLSVNGKIQTGLRVTGATHHKGNAEVDGIYGIETPNAFAYSDDIDNGTPFRTDLTLQYAFENVGIKTVFRYQPDGTGANFKNPFNSDNGLINSAFIWGTVLNKTIKVSAGKSIDAAWKIFYSDYSGNDQVSHFDGKDGVRIEVMPVKGLNVGAFYGSGDLFNKAVNDKGDPGYTDVSEQDGRFVLGAKYDSSRFAVVASWYHNFNDFEKDGAKLERNYDDYGWKNGLEGDPRYIKTALPNTSNLLIGAQLKGTDSLPLTVDLSMAFANLGSMTVAKNVWDDEENYADKGEYYEKGDFNPYWSFQPKLKAGYDINDKFSVSLELTDMLIADKYYSAASSTDTDQSGSGLGLFFPITINLEPGYAITDNLSAALQLSFKVHPDGGDQFGIGVKPGFEFDLGHGATFVVYDELVFYTQSKYTKPDEKDWQDKHVGVKDVVALNGTSGTANTLQFDFVWSF